MANNGTSAAVNEDIESMCTLNGKQQVRDQLELDMQVFLSKGGAIEEVGMNISADPPIKPTSKYGGQPI